MYGYCSQYVRKQQPAITSYDGTIIDIPQGKIISFYRSVNSYLIYLAVSKNGEAPEFSYPNPADSKADWYFLSQMIDWHNYDSTYEYKTKLPAIKAGKKPYWFWIGMLKENVKPFDKIPGWYLGLGIQVPGGTLK